MGRQGRPRSRRAVGPGDAPHRPAVASHVLVVLACIAIFLPLVLTLYLSVFDETLIVFPPKGYTLAWYPAIMIEIRRRDLDQPAHRARRRRDLAADRRARRDRAVALPLPRARRDEHAAALAADGARHRDRARHLRARRLGGGAERRGIAGSLSLLIAAHVLITLPWVVRLCLASLTNHERATEEAATSLGATPLAVIWRVTLPAMRSGIVAAGLFAFIVSFENLEMTLFLVAPGVTTLPISVLNYLLYHIDPLVAAVAVAQMAIIGVALRAAGSLRPARSGGSVSAYLRSTICRRATATRRRSTASRSMSRRARWSCCSARPAAARRRRCA